MARIPVIPKRLRRRIFRGQAAVNAGLLTKAQLRSDAWRRLFRGVYCDAALPLANRVRAQGAALLLPDRGAVAGLAAAAYYGVDLARLDERVEVIVPPGCRRAIRGLRVRCRQLADDEIDTYGLVRVTTPARTAWDVAATLPVLRSVPVLDALVRARIVTPSELVATLLRHRGSRGYRAAELAFSWIDSSAESPPESKVRVIFWQAQIRVVPQYELREGDRHIARFDFALPELKIAIEYDGVWHADAIQLRSDRRRLNEILAQGWVVFHITSSDLGNPDQLVARFRDFIAKRRV